MSDDDVRLVPRPATTLRERVAERIYVDAMLSAGVKPKALDDAPWETMREPLRVMWLRYADSALAVVRDFGTPTPTESSPS